MPSEANLYTSLYFIYTINGREIEIEIDNVIPDALSYSYSPNYSGQATLGRMSPIQIYSGGSNKEYSFTLTVHEDMIKSNSKFDSIISFVNAIKSLSYPTVLSNGVVVKPQVRFYLGKISGAGIVKTSINWLKPFRNGRYVMAEISFSITVEQINNAPRVRTETTTEVVEGSVVYNEKVIIESSEELLLNNTVFGDFGSYYERDGTKYFDVSDYDTPLNNLLDTRGSTPAQKLSNAIFTKNYFDMSRELIRKILGESSVDDPQEEIAVRHSLWDLSRISLDLYNYIETGGSNPLASFSSVKEDLDDLEEKFTAYLDYYYDNVDRDMTRDEYDKILGEIIILIDNMRDMYEEINKYGAIN